MPDDPLMNSEPPAPSPPAPPLPVRRKLLFAIVFMVLLIGLVEFVCRLLGLGHSEEVARHVADWHHAPHGRAFWVVRGEGHNRDGLRDRDHAVPKPPDTFRVICLGDSVTVGHGVKRSESWPFALEAYFKQLSLPMDMEVFTIATSGWSTLQETTAYRELARKYAPDQVFLGFCLNDVAEMQNNLTRPPPGAISLAMKHSAAARWLANARGREVHSVRELFVDPEPPAVATGWERVFGELLALRDAVRADGATLSIVIFPFRFQLEPNAPPSLAQQRLFAFCRGHEIPCLDLLDALRALGQDAMIDESHLSPAGARAAAEAVIAWGRTGCMMCGQDHSHLAADTRACPRCAWPTQ